MAPASQAQQPGQTHADEVIAAAEHRLAGGSPVACLALLAVLPQPLHQLLPVRQMQALCQVQLASGSCSTGASKAWWKVGRRVVCFATPQRGVSSHRLLDTF